LRRAHPGELRGDSERGLPPARLVESSAAGAPSFCWKLNDYLVSGLDAVG